MTTQILQPDTIDTLHGAQIQHGPFNQRIYLMKIGDANPERLLPALDELAQQNGYTKIFAKIPAAAAPPFEEAGYTREAGIPNAYGGREDAVFLGRFLDPQRAQAPDRDTIDKVLELACAKQDAALASPLPPLPGKTRIRTCTEADADAMSRLYSQVFDTYPFPIDQPDYLRETMRTHVIYFCVETPDGQLAALSSAEMDAGAANVEMTDFATHPDWLGNGLAVHLLSTMEPCVSARGIRTAYTIARAASAGMNITFAKLGYRFGGCLINNTNISGRIESMNIWHKPMPLG